METFRVPLSLSFHRRLAIVFAAIFVLALARAACAIPQYFPGTGHSYDVILRPGGITWTDARAEAEAQVWQGHHGYLATIGSEEENRFVFDLSLNSGVWYLSTIWMVGPWLGGRQEEGAIEPAGGWTWASGEPLGFTAWLDGQPDNNDRQGMNENSLCFWGEMRITPTWNDYTDVDPPGGEVRGYAVEFDGGPTGVDPVTWGQIRSLFR